MQARNDNRPKYAAPAVTKALEVRGVRAEVVWLVAKELEKARARGADFQDSGT